MSASPWDRLPHPNPLGYVPRDNRTPYRIERFEAAAADPTTPRSELSAELRRRWNYWRPLLDPPRKGSYRALGRIGGPNIMTILWLALFFASTAATATFGKLTSGAALIAMIVFGTIVARLNWQEGKRILPRRAILEGICPSCEFELAGLDAFPPEELDGQHIGPRRCPECGTPWPLVPPPCPREPLPLCQAPATA